MSSTITERSQFPDAPYYVCSNDTFMSGWGKSAGCTNTIVLPCESLEEAEQVAEYARSRGDQQYVRINTTKPKMKGHVLYSLMTREEATAWYPRKD